MTGLETDQALILALCEWAKLKPSAIASRAGVAATTINRPAAGTATTRISQPTLEKMKMAFPDFPGFQNSRPSPNAVPVRMEGASSERMRNDLPIFGTALGAALIMDGESIEQTTLNRDEVVEYVKRPVILNGNANAYGLYVQGSSMAPAHVDGALILAERRRPLRIGDDVVVYLRANGDQSGHDADDGERARSVLVKRLVRRSAQYVELEQFTPPRIFRIETVEIVRIDRVLTLGDLLS